MKGDIKYSDFSSLKILKVPQNSLFHVLVPECCPDKVTRCCDSPNFSRFINNEK